jgi:hypothetical protein
LAETVEQVKLERERGRPICAVKGALPFLVEHGIEPDLFVSLDPRPRIQHVTPQTETTLFLVASRCAPELFEAIGDRPCMLWHAASGEEENRVLHELGIQYMIGGTSTSGLRCVNLAYYMGFRRVAMYGMDSCNAKDGITKRIDGSLTGQTVPVVVDGQEFICNVAMAQQAEDFQKIWVMMPDMQVEVYGGGLLAAILAARRKRGYWT